MVHAARRYVLGEWLPEAMADLLSMIESIGGNPRKMSEWFTRWGISTEEIDKAESAQRQTNINTLFDRLNGRLTSKTDVRQH